LRTTGCSRSLSSSSSTGSGTGSAVEAITGHGRR
jgi:hypothetical protein